MTSRKLSYPVFDADNHFYQTQDALTMFLPDNRKHVRGRTKIVVRGWEDNFAEIVDLVGADRVVFGSDWPHPEALKEPLRWSMIWPGYLTGISRKSWAPT